MNNAPEPTSRALETRIEELESRLAFQEDTLSALNLRIAEQDQELARLQLQLKHVNEKLKQSSDTPSGAGDFVDERPPHY